MEKMKNFLNSLSESITITKKDGLLMLLVAALAGCIFGMLSSPRRNLVIGCGNACQSYLGEPEEDKEGINHKEDTDHKKKG